MNGRLVMTTCADRAAAESLGRTLVEERLAACVNVLPGFRSIYRWQGQIEAAEECLLLVKTTRERYDAAAARLVELQSQRIAQKEIARLIKEHRFDFRASRHIPSPRDRPASSSAVGSQQSAVRQPSEPAN